MGNHLAPTLERPHFDRIRAVSADAVNEEIDAQVRRNIERFSRSPEAIERRLRELDEEWDVDRALMANFSVLAFAGLAAGALKDRKWLILPAVQLPFLLWHAARGWCPPLPLFRRLGFRSRQEIEMEKVGLRKAGATHYQETLLSPRGDGAACPTG